MDLAQAELNIARAVDAAAVAGATPRVLERVAVLAAERCADAVSDGRTVLPRGGLESYLVGVAARCAERAARARHD